MADMTKEEKIKQLWNEVGQHQNALNQLGVDISLLMEVTEQEKDDAWQLITDQRSDCPDDPNDLDIAVQIEAMREEIADDSIAAADVDASPLGDGSN